ncbi:hypothetical protein HAALTHF_13990n [Vreelandella aquamarina]|nr:hypothetical protein HAALTHF_13990n [Halomonas axialensis]
MDIVITTALIPGKPAPKLWLEDMVAAMKPGSVIVDLAAEKGGNCDLTKPGERVVSDNGVVVVGYTDFPLAHGDTGLTALRHQYSPHAHRPHPGERRRYPSQHG